MDFEPLNIDNEAMESDGDSGEEEEEEEEEEEQDEEEEDTGGLDLEHYYDDDDTITTVQTSVSGDPNLEPYQGMEFDSEQSARIFYNSFARRIGFSTRMSVYQRSRRDGSIICRQVVCSREGYRRGGTQSKSKRQRSVTRVGCKAQMTVKKQTSGKWTVTKLVKEHNHELVPTR